MSDRTFIKITNKDIYDKLLTIEEHVKETNGKVKLNALLSRTALVVSLIAIGIVTGVNIVGIL